MAKPVLTISSKNYGAWALRGWLMCRLAGLEFSEKVIPPDDPAMRPRCCCCLRRCWCPRCSTAA